MRSGRGQILGLHADDPILRWIGPLGLALSWGTALIVDLEHEISSRTLADIRSEGPRLEEISPGRTGVATISAGAINAEAVDECVSLLARNWPAVVVRSDGDRWPGSVVPYRSALPGILAESTEVPAVWQVAAGAESSGLRGVLLPDVGSRSVRAMLEGRTPRHGQWVRAWRKVWERPWA